MHGLKITRHAQESAQKSKLHNRRAEHKWACTAEITENWGLHKPLPQGVDHRPKQGLTRLEVEAAQQVRQVGHWLLKGGQKQLQHQRGARVCCLICSLPICKSNKKKHVSNADWVFEILRRVHAITPVHDVSGMLRQVIAFTDRSGGGRTSYRFSNT